MHRTEFRNTHGTVAQKEMMDKIQIKMQECINKGSMNSIERISNLLSAKNALAASAPPTADDGDVTMDGAAPAAGKDSSKIPHKKAKREKHHIPNEPGSRGYAKKELKRKLMRLRSQRRTKPKDQGKLRTTGRKNKKNMVSF